MNGEGWTRCAGWFPVDSRCGRAGENEDATIDPFLRPERNENLEKFMLRAREQAYKCNFGKSSQESRDISVIDKIILLAPTDLKERPLQKGSLELDEVFKMVAAYQAVKFPQDQVGYK